MYGTSLGLYSDVDGIGGQVAGEAKGPSEIR